MTLSFFAHGTPKGQPRVKACRRGAHAGVYDPGTADNWKASIRAAARDKWDGVPFVGPVRVDVVAHFPRPKGHFGTGKNAEKLKPNAPQYHTSTPDRDNVDKAILDALTGLGIWADDAQACAGGVLKYYTAGRTGAGASVEITSL